MGWGGGWDGVVGGGGVWGGGGVGWGGGWEGVVGGAAPPESTAGSRIDGFGAAGSARFGRRRGVGLGGWRPPFLFLFFPRHTWVKVATLTSILELPKDLVPIVIFQWVVWPSLKVRENMVPQQDA